MSNISFFKKYGDVFKAIIVLTAVCLVISAALAFTNNITKDKIAEIEAATANSAMSALIKGDKYDAMTDQIYGVTEMGVLKGYIITTTAKGYGGDVKVMTAISPENKIIGINILSAADETPGLGQNATKPDFYEQFAGKGADVVVVKNGAKDNEINAVTGATITSRAVTNAVNEAFKIFNEYLQNAGAMLVPITETTEVQ